MTLETYVATAARQDAERLRAHGNLGWYLRHEFRGGTTLEQILVENRAETSTLRAVVSRAVRLFRFSRRHANSSGANSDD